MNADDKIKEAVEIAGEYGEIDGDHHKMWVIDKMVAVLLGEEAYEQWKIDMRGECIDGEYEYGEWAQEACAP